MDRAFRSTRSAGSQHSGSRQARDYTSTVPWNSRAGHGVSIMCQAATMDHSQNGGSIGRKRSNPKDHRELGGTGGVLWCRFVCAGATGNDMGRLLQTLVRIAFPPSGPRRRQFAGDSFFRRLSYRHTKSETSGNNLSGIHAVCSFLFRVPGACFLCDKPGWPELD